MAIVLCRQGLEGEGKGKRLYFQGLLPSDEDVMCTGVEGEKRGQARPLTSRPSKGTTGCEQA